MNLDRSIRTVAAFEAFKGVLALLGAAGLLSLLHRDVQRIALTLVEHAHLNPAAHYPRIFLDAAARTGDARLTLLAAGAALYAAMRLAEAWGLWFQRTWAAWLAAVSGAIYVPFEVAGLVREPGWHGAVLLAVNLAIVGLMVARLRGSATS